MVESKTLLSRTFSVVNYTLLVLIGLVTILPFIDVVASSFTTTAEIARKGFVLFPSEWSFAAYDYIFSTSTFLRSIANSVGITVVGTLFSMFITCLMSYGLTRRDLDGKRTIMFLVVFTLLFHGFLIPTFLVVKEVGLIDSYWSLILPVTVNAMNMIILRTFFMALPEGLEESAKIDGCSDFGILFKIVLPLSLPALATVSLFYAVYYWNSYIPAILYLNDSDKWPIQVILRQIVIVADGLSVDNTAVDEVPPPAQSVKMAAIFIATLPILLVYPFLQKYFTKGALIGSLKG
ncbi:MAG TPA: carbohydrate ABC transporter permease [Bacilli bacterium]